MTIETNIFPAPSAAREGNKGMVMIVDISGFTRFVQRVDDRIGVKVIKNLLRVLIECNHLDLQIAEIEGDAILFYRYGAAPTAMAIKEQFEGMLAAFLQEINHVAARVPEATSLSVKMVATYGELTSFSLAGFHKIYGEAVIKAHRLLKNHIGAETYLLIEEDLLSQQENPACRESNVSKKCQVYDLGLICYRYIAYPAPQKTQYISIRQRVQERPVDSLPAN